MGSQRQRELHPVQRLRGRRCGGDGMTTTRLRASEANDRLTVALINAASHGYGRTAPTPAHGFGLATIQPTEPKGHAYAKAVRCSIPATRSGNTNASVSGPDTIAPEHQARQHDQ
jgi:hypothetical protein